MSDKAIYKIDLKGYYAELCGIFTEEKEFVEQCEGLVFSEEERTGKYQAIEVNIDKDVKFVTDELDAINEFEGYNMMTGYNPFDEIRTRIKYGEIGLKEGFYRINE